MKIRKSWTLCNLRLLCPLGSLRKISVYGALYEKSGFQIALQVPIGHCLKKPTLQIQEFMFQHFFYCRQKDYFLKFPGVQDYISGLLKILVPNLQMVNLPEGSHFVQEQLPDEVNGLVLDFLTENNQS